MNRTYPLDIAARAANLSERVQVVSALGTADGPDGPRPTLDAYGVWQMERLAGRLVVRPREEGHDSVRYSRQALVETLTAYRRHEKHLDPRAARVLRDLHHAWLPTYEAALDGLHDAGPATPD